MKTPVYTVRVITSKAQKAWDSLVAGLQSEIEDELRTCPRHNPGFPRLHSHLKGKIEGHDRRCHYQYKGLPGGWRVFYTVDDSARRVEIEYIGPHP